MDRLVDQALRLFAPGNEATIRWAPSSPVHPYYVQGHAPSCVPVVLRCCSVMHALYQLPRPHTWEIGLAAQTVMVW